MRGLYGEAPLICDWCSCKEVLDLALPPSLPVGVPAGRHWSKLVERVPAMSTPFDDWMLVLLGPLILMLAGALLRLKMVSASPLAPCLALPLLQLSLKEDVNSRLGLSAGFRSLAIHLETKRLPLAKA